MKRVKTAAVLALAATTTATIAATAAPVGAADYQAFRACVEAVEDAAVTATFHHCAAEIAAPCGASATAKEAAACIDAKRVGIEAEIDAQIARLAAAEGDRETEVRSALDANRAAGVASCAVVAQRDASSGVAIGQRAVNGAFCQLVVSGDVLGLAYRLEAEE